jgi:hypothetical protein
MAGKAARASRGRTVNLMELVYGDAHSMHRLSAAVDPVTKQQQQQLQSQQSQVWWVGMVGLDGRGKSLPPRNNSESFSKIIVRFPIAFHPQHKKLLSLAEYRRYFLFMYCSENVCLLSQHSIYFRISSPLICPSLPYSLQKKSSKLDMFDDEGYAAKKQSNADEDGDDDDEDDDDEDDGDDFFQPKSSGGKSGGKAAAAPTAGELAIALDSTKIRRASINNNYKSSSSSSPSTSSSSSSSSSSSTSWNAETLAALKDKFVTGGWKPKSQPGSGDGGDDDDDSDGENDDGDDVMGSSASAAAAAFLDPDAAMSEVCEWWGRFNLSVRDCRSQLFY